MKLLKMVTVMTFAGMVAGCVTTPPVIMENAFQRKVITPCDNDIFCLRSSYSVTWDYTRNSCISGYYRDGCVQAPNYPVSYKNSEYIVETGSNGYRITMPSGGTVKMFD
jgi:hypothetical protein